MTETMFSLGFLLQQTSNPIVGSAVGRMQKGLFHEVSHFKAHLNLPWCSLAYKYAQ